MALFPYTGQYEDELSFEVSKAHTSLFTLTLRTEIKLICGQPVYVVPVPVGGRRDPGDGQGGGGLVAGRDRGQAGRLPQQLRGAGQM